MKATGADRSVGAAVDCEPGSARPAAGRMRLVAGEREQAAAVVGAEACAGHLVGDRKAPGRRPRAGSSDADTNPADDATVDPDAEQLPGEIGLELEPDAAEGERTAVSFHPTKAAVRHRCRDHAEPVAALAHDRQRQPRAVNGPRA